MKNRFYLRHRDNKHENPDLFKEELLQLQEAWRVYRKRDACIRESSECPIECLRAEKLQDIWTTVYKKDQVTFIILDTAITSVIKASVVINEELDLLVHIGQRNIDQLSKYKFPIKVNNVIVVHEILYELALKVQMKSSHDFPKAFDFIVDLLENMLSDLDDDKKLCSIS
ncbi:hypothetical protein NPIL_52101 [Nephila pilipes]|uniref:Uncharacterized protein n=1 Tax=Nephila pilipes TaxID=299642 RepID=A0A8X6NXH6_NEPPI|nr:hypothetical protein NPIL_52101 [Nephila pilipes]